MTDGASSPTIAGYELLERLGAGGMGEVFRARQRVLDRLVALKLLHLVAAADPGLLLRFHREGEILASLNHPHLVRLLDAGVEDRTPWIAMELVSGSTLARLIDRRVPVPLEVLLPVALQLASAVSYLHAQGVVHRDLKPGNVLLSAAGEVKIADFGLARVSGATLMTQAGALVGTLAYMAPESVDSQEPSGPPSDVYALGIILFELAVGHTPYRGRNFQHWIELLRDPKVPDPRSLRPDLPVGWAALVLAMLERDPSKRVTAPEVERALQQFGRVDAAQDRRTRTLLTELTAGEPATGSWRTKRAKSSGKVAAPGGSGATRIPGSSAMRWVRRWSLRTVGALLVLTAALAAARAWRKDSFPVEVRAGTWEAPVQLVVPRSTGIPLHPARLTFSQGAPVFGAVESDGLVFHAGLEHLPDLSSAMVAEVEEHGVNGATPCKLALDTAQVQAVQAEWNRRALEVAATAELAGAPPVAGDPAQDYTVAAFEGSAPLPPDVVVRTTTLEQALPAAFRGAGAGWRSLGAWMAGAAPLDVKLRVYRALARWEAGALELGRLPRINAFKSPNDPPPRPAHPLIAVLRSLVTVRSTYRHESVFGIPERTLGISNAGTFRWLRQTRVEVQSNPDTLADLTGALMMKDMGKVVDGAIPPGPLHARLAEKLAFRNWECARLAGIATLEVDPVAGVGLPTTRARDGLRIDLLEQFPTVVVRVTIPLAAGPPLDVWLTQPRADHHRAACPERCRTWRHTQEYEILLPHGLAAGRGRRVGLRMGPARPEAGGTRLLCERVDGQFERQDAPEAGYASVILGDIAWLRAP